MRARCNQSGRLRDAEAAFRTVLAFQPDHAEALWSVGVLARQRGDLDAATEALTRAANARPHGNQRSGSSSPRCVLLQRSMTRREKPSDGRSKLKPDWVDALGLLAEIEIRAGDGPAALRPAQRVLRMRPELAAAHVLFGSACAVSGRLADAEAAFRRALELAPEDAWATAQLANALRDQGRLGEAEPLYRAALERAPEAAELLVELGDAYVMAGRLARRGTGLPRRRLAATRSRSGLDEPLRAGEAAWRSRAHRRGRTRCGRGLASLRGSARHAVGGADRAGRPRRRRDDARARRAPPASTRPGCGSSLGSALRVGGRLEEAAAVLAEAVAAAPDDVDAPARIRAHAARARQVRRGARRSARRAADAGRRQDVRARRAARAPSSPISGRWDDAIRAYESALWLAPAAPDLLVALARALRGALRLEEARLRCQEALALVPTHQEALESPRASLTSAPR